MYESLNNIYAAFFGVGEYENHAFSFFRRPVRNTEPMRAIEIPDIYRYIKGTYAKRQTDALRAMTDRDAARKFKAENFDYCTFSGVFRTRNKSDLLLHSDLICLDFDHVADIPSLKERLLHDEYFETELLFRSPSGDGLKWVVSIDRQGFEHSDCFTAIYNYLVANGYPEPDRACSDGARACFLPYDPEVFINKKYKHTDEETFFRQRLGECPF